MLIFLAWRACLFYSSDLLVGFEAFVAHKYVLSQPSLPFFAYHLMHGKFGILPEYDHTNLSRQAVNNFVTSCKEKT